MSARGADGGLRQERRASAVSGYLIFKRNFHRKIGDKSSWGVRRIRHRSGISSRRVQLRRHMFRIFFGSHIVGKGSSQARKDIAMRSKLLLDGEVARCPL